MMTRPAPASARFAALAERRLGRFGQVVISPMLEIVPLMPAPEIPAEAALAFTSENAVRIAATRFDPTGRPAWCVGDRTADVARQMGFAARSAGGDAAALADLLGEDAPDKEILHLSGVHQTGDLAERLALKGLRARRVAIYDQRPLPLSSEARAALKAPTPVALPLFSPRSAALTRTALPNETQARLLLPFLSPAVARAWAEGGSDPRWRSAVAPTPDAEGMLRALGDVLEDAAE
ncbi:MAG: uroporphyrinogen-III synthase [Pseudomonadota bacterium]